MTTRIIGGKFKSTRLAVPAGPGVRPTLGRVRENLFNILGKRVADALFLDLYAGLGAVGLEALSRGARRCVFVESAPAGLRAIAENIARLNVEENCAVVRRSFSRALPLLAQRGEVFDVIFADPPYGRGLAAGCLDKLSRSALLGADSLCIIQTGRKENLAPAAGRLGLTRRADYGATSLWFYTPRGHADR